MNEEDLSPAAQRKLIKLERATVAGGGDWLPHYMAMLKELAERDTSDVTEWEIKGQGIEILEKTREEYRIAVELKTYAIAQIPVDISAEVAKLPESVSLDEFLGRLMPNSSAEDRRREFSGFLRDWAEAQIDEQMELHPKKLSRDKYVAQIAKVRLENLQSSNLPRILQYDLREEFSSWLKPKKRGATLAATNAKKRTTKAQKMEKMLSLLPHSKRANQVMSLKIWRDRAVEILNIPDRTFDRYRKELEGRYIEHPKGKFRVDNNTRETK